MPGGDGPIMSDEQIRAALALTTVSEGAASTSTSAQVVDTQPLSTYVHVVVYLCSTYL